MFNEYKLKQIFKEGGNSLKVTLLENDKGHKIIKKQYDPSISAHRESFTKEIKILSRIESYKFSPKLLHVDYDNYVFYETYCGQVLPKTHSNYNKKVIERTKDLCKKYNVEYIKNGRQRWILYWKNYCILDGEIYMIDFGSANWKIYDVSENGNISKSVPKSDFRNNSKNNYKNNYKNNSENNNKGYIAENDMKKLKSHNKKIIKGKW